MKWFTSGFQSGSMQSCDSFRNQVKRLRANCSGDAAIRVGSSAPAPA
ncbi:hypothetical protein [Bosea sp. Root670]